MKTLEATPQTIKGIIEQRFNKRNLPLTVSLQQLGFELPQVHKLRRVIQEIFGPYLQIALYDDIMAIHRMLKANQSTQ